MSSPPKGRVDRQAADGYPLWVEVEWRSDDELLITYDPEAEVDAKEAKIKVGGMFGGGTTIHVRYKPNAAARRS